MALTDKEAALEAIEHLADDASFEHIYDALRYTRRVRERIAEGIDAADSGETVPHEEIVQEFTRWAESVGQSLPEETSSISEPTSAATRQGTR
jgi:predicted transcriptional regulator